MPTIDWSGAADFGLEDNFVTARARQHQRRRRRRLRVPADQRRRFAAATSTTPSSIDNDGLHGADVQDGTVTLTAGYHPLRIEYFEAPAASSSRWPGSRRARRDFAVVPNTVLSTDAGVVRVTAPGRKQCEGANDTPGDGLPLDAVQPGLHADRPAPAPGSSRRCPGWTGPPTAGWSSPPGAAASNDHSARSTSLSNVTGATGPAKVTYKKVASGLREPMGLAVVDGMHLRLAEARADRAAATPTATR